MRLRVKRRIDKRGRKLKPFETLPEAKKWARRRDEVATMKWQGNPGSLQLRPLALDIIYAQPRVSGNRHALPAARGDGPLNGFNKGKAAFDRPSGVFDPSTH